MTEIQNSQDFSSDKIVSRRSFIKGAGILGLAIGLKSIIGGDTVKYSNPEEPLLQSEESLATLEKLRAFEIDKDNPELFRYLEQHEQYLSSIEQIFSDRKKIGLSSFPQEIRMYKPKKASQEWKTSSIAFEKDLPIDMEKLGSTTQAFLHEIYSENFTKTVYGIKTGEGTQFDQMNRYIHYPEKLNYSTTSSLMVIAHEGGGHGIDPGMFAYPPEKFFPLEAAKWKMLSQSNAIEGQFLKHPCDSVHAICANVMGQDACKNILVNQQFPNLSGAERIKYLIKETANELDISDSTIIFTKRFAYELGLKIYQDIMSGEETFLQKRYESFLDNASCEIYAEMIKWSLFSPSTKLFNEDNITAAMSTQGNQIIQSAVENTIQIIREDKQDIKSTQNSISRLIDTLPTDNIDNIPPLITPTTTSIDTQSENEPLIESKTDTTALPSKQITPIIIETQSFNEQVATPLPITEITPSTTNGKLTEREVEEKSSEMMKSIIQNGSVDLDSFSSLPNDQMEIIEKYFDLYRQIRDKYPRIREHHNNPKAGIEAFDPPTMNFWESDLLQKAVSDDVINTLINEAITNNKIDTSIDNMRKNISILKIFTSTNMKTLGIPIPENCE